MKRFLFIILILVFFYHPSFAEFPAVDVYQKTSKAVVLILGFGTASNSMVGAGAIIDNSGKIITNAHLVIDKSTLKPYSKIKVYLKPKNVTGNFSEDLVNGHIAKVLAFDVELDLAVLKVDELNPDRGIIELADSGKIRIGEEVVAIGHPEQGGLWTLSYGRISGEILNQNNIQGKDVFQTDTSMNRGNSGGPLLDRRGYLVGLNTNIARLGAGNLPITGVNFSVKSSVVKSWLDKQGLMIAYGQQSLYSDNRPTEARGKIETPQTNPAGNITTDKILTPKRPYNTEDLFKEAEKEMEDLMEEMRGKIRGR